MAHLIANLKKAFKSKVSCIALDKLAALSEGDIHHLEDWDILTEKGKKNQYKDLPDPSTHLYILNPAKVNEVSVKIDVKQIRLLDFNDVKQGGGKGEKRGMRLNSTKHSLQIRSPSAKNKDGKALLKYKPQTVKSKSYMNKLFFGANRANKRKSIEVMKKDKDIRLYAPDNNTMNLKDFPDNRNIYNRKLFPSKTEEDQNLDTNRKPSKSLILSHKHNELGQARSLLKEKGNRNNKSMLKHNIKKRASHMSKLNRPQL